MDLQQVAIIRLGAGDLPIENPRQDAVENPVSILFDPQRALGGEKERLLTN
jgi:hypothetical protein